MTAGLGLAGRVALVTGAGRGIGRATALRLAADGAAVAVNYRADDDAAAEVVAAIARGGGRAHAYRASVDDEEAVAEMAAAVRRDLGIVDLLVSNAGQASRGRTVYRTTDDEYRALMETHAFGPLRLVRLLLPGMREAGRAHVVIVSSAITDTCPAGASPYVMAKAAMEAAARTLAKEERPHGIRVNVVAPGLVATDMGDRLVRATSGTGIDDVSSALPFGRACTPEDVAGVVAVLVSPDTGYVTGQRLLVDGGGPDVTASGL